MEELELLSFLFSWPYERGGPRNACQERVFLSFCWDAFIDWLLIKNDCI